MLRRISRILRGWRIFTLSAGLICFLAIPILLAPWSGEDGGTVLSMPVSWFFALIVFPVVAPLFAGLAWNIASRTRRR